MKPRLYADFNAPHGDGEGIALDRMGTLRDLTEMNLTLSDGMKLLLYTDDADERGKADPLLVDAVARYDEAAKCFYAVADWDTLRHQSDDGKPWIERSLRLKIGESVGHQSGLDRIEFKE